MKNAILAAAVVALASAAALTGCAGAASPSESPEPLNTQATIPPIPKGTGIARLTNLTGCETTPGTVQAKGTIVIPKGMKKDPVISVSWVDPKTSTAYTRGLTTIKSDERDVPVTWTITATLPPTATPISCVLGAVVPD